MTPENFVYWLEGFFALTAAERNAASMRETRYFLTQEQIEMIISRLSLVSVHKATEGQPATWHDARPMDWHRVKTGVVSEARAAAAGMAQMYPFLLKDDLTC